MNKTKFAAILMTALIIMLPLCSVSAFASNELVITKRSGNDNIEGALRVNDVLTVQVDAKLDNDADISSSQLKIGGREFSACSASLQSGHFVCRYTEQQPAFTPGAYPFSVTLFSDDGESLKTASSEIFIDSLPPLIYFDRAPIQTMQNISVQFTIRDQAWQPGAYIFCSGVKKIEFYDSAVKLNEIIVSERTCVYSDTILLKVPASGRVTIKAYDAFNQVSTSQSASFELDNSPPVIDQNSFKAYLDEAELGQYIRAGTYPLNLEVEITESSLKAQNVIADLSSIGGSSEIPADSCIKNNAKYKCIWSEASITISSSKTAAFVIKATDDFGNTGAKTISKQLTVDSSGPSVSSLTSSNTFESISYIGSNPIEIHAVISESGAGINSANILLDLSSLNSAYASPKPADECVQRGNVYDCVWRGITTTNPSGIYTISFDESSADGAGNPITGAVDLSIIADDNPPEIVGNITTRVITTREQSSDLIVSGDDLEITFQAKDSQGISAVADLSKVLNDQTKKEVAVECAGLEGVYSCKLAVVKVATGYLETSIEITVYDGAGNTKKITVPIIIYGRDDTINPNYWSSSALESIPPAIDRQVLPIRNQRIYFPITLSSSLDARIIKMWAAECRGKHASYIKEAVPAILNSGEGSTKPILMLELKTTEDRLNDLQFNCTLKIISIVNKKISGIETEEIPMTVKFYNLPLGEVSDSLINKMEKTYDTYVKSWWGTIGAIQEYMKYATTICNTFYTIRQIISWLQGISTVLMGVAKATKGTYAYAAVEGIRNVFCETTETSKKTVDQGGLKSLMSYMDKFCGFVNCRANPKKADENKQSSWSDYFDGRSNWLDKASGYQWPNLLSGKKGDGLYTTTERNRYYDKSGYMDVKKSLTASILSFCIPGILYNMEKYRQIQCMYLYCLENGISTGVPTYACDQVKEYQTCKYIYGEIFQIVSYVIGMDYYINKIKKAISDPFAIIGAALSIYCGGDKCSDDEGSKQVVCNAINIAAELLDIIQNVKALMDEWDTKLTYDYCKEVKKPSSFVRRTPPVDMAADTSASTDTTTPATTTDTTAGTNTGADTSAQGTAAS